MAEKQLNTVIILRNDTKESWEADGSYVLRNGEVGVGYVDIKDDEGNVTKTVVMAKIGNGQKSWKDLPQLEGVFEEDQILTYNFGRHKTTNGYVNAGGAGMTTSEWLLDALSEILLPTINYPSVSLTGGAYIEGASSTATSAEIGSKITALRWDGTFSAGSYKDAANSGTYGTTTNKTSNATGLAASNVTWAIANNKDSQTATTEDGKFTLTSDKYIQLTAEASTTYAKVTATATLDASNSYVPLNNVGSAYAAGKIAGFDKAGTTTKNLEGAVNVSAYRKPFWGVIAAAEGLKSPENYTSADVRALPKSGTSNGGLPTSLEVPAGSQMVVFFAKAGAKTSLTATDDKAMNAGVTFTKVANAVNVEGANGYTATAYDLWYVDWKAGIGSAKQLTLKWS